MQVIKDNFNKPKTESSGVQDICEYCNSLFEYDFSDITYGAYGLPSVVCPCCGKLTILNDENLKPLVLTPQNLSFPKHFLHLDGADIKHERKTLIETDIENSIIQGIKDLSDNPNENFWYSCGGDYMIGIVRLIYENIYSIFVSKDYYETEMFINIEQKEDNK